MKSGLLALGAAATLAAAAPLQAQSVEPRCTGAFAGPAQVGGDACQKVVDLYQYMNAQLGTPIAGGNATLGQGGALGGPGLLPSNPGPDPPPGGGAGGGGTRTP